MNKFSFVLTLLIVLFSLSSNASSINEKFKQLTARSWSSKTKKHTVQFVGSSTIEGWKVHEISSSLNTLNYGVGGSQYSDLVKYFDLVFTHNTKKIVIYSGDNDLSSGKSPVEISEIFKTLHKKILMKYAQVKIVIIGVKISPSHKRARRSQKVRELNKLLRDYSVVTKNLEYVELNYVIKPTEKTFMGIKRGYEFYQKDGVHFNKKGYRALNNLVRPFLNK